MTFNQAKEKLDQMTEKEFDKYSKLLANLHKKVACLDKESAEAIEIAGMAMMLYCKK